MEEISLISLEYRTVQPENNAIQIGHQWKKLCRDRSLWCEDNYVVRFLHISKSHNYSCSFRLMSFNSPAFYTDENTYKKYEKVYQFHLYIRGNVPDKDFKAFYFPVNSVYMFSFKEFLKLIQKTLNMVFPHNNIIKYNDNYGFFSGTHYKM